MIKKYEIIFYMISFVLLSMFFIFNDLSVLSTNDDLAAYNLLTSNYYGTLILSYPLSFLIANLYDILPTFQWYSSLLLIIVLLNMSIVSFYLKTLNNKSQKIVMFIFFIILFSYVYTNISITIVTILTMFSALIISKKNIIFTALMILIATLLRTDIAIISIPFIGVGYLILNSHFKYSSKIFASLIFIGILIIANIISPKLDKEYFEWFLVNKSIGKIIDFKGHSNSNTLNDEQKVLIKSWWYQDKEILPTEKVLESVPTVKDIVLQKLSTFNSDTLVYHRYRLFLLLLIVATLLMILKNHTYKKTILYILFTLGFILLLYMRDQDRVTVVLLFIWSFIIFGDAKKYIIQTSLYLIFVISLSCFYWYDSILYSNNDTHFLKKEAKKLVEKNSLKCEISIVFPTDGFAKVTNNILIGNILFKENDWMKLDGNIVISGWLSWLPFFYKTHNIGKEDRYKTYYQFLIAKDTGFLGGGKVSTTPYSKTILSLYDKTFLKNKKSCRHIIKIVDRSKNFTISQMKIQCLKNKE